MDLYGFSVAEQVCFHPVKSDFLFKPTAIEVFDSLVLVHDPVENNTYTLFRLGASSPLLSGGQKGSGPDDILYGQFIDKINEKEFQVVDIASRKTMVYNLDSILQTRTFRPVRSFFYSEAESQKVEGMQYAYYVDDSQKIELRKDMIGDIVFENVSFRYGSRKEVFNGLNLKIDKGKTTAVIGESGSGKTTLISLLQHIYPIQSGQIRIGGYDISQISNKSLRSLVGTVPQQIELFAGTIIENIAVGDLQPDMKRIVDLVEQLGLKDFIERLPNGYMTYIGEHGASLSGGERQRIAIARALYKEPEILIFDEATSSLDSISEKHVKRTLDALASSGKTVIIIAHRLSTVKNADMIVVLDNGKVSETGTHKQLFNSNGIYNRLWNEQFDQLD